jgi:hypothetical protein
MKRVDRYKYIFVHYSHILYFRQNDTPQSVGHCQIHVTDYELYVVVRLTNDLDDRIHLTIGLSVNTPVPLKVRPYVIRMFCYHTFKSFMFTNKIAGASVAYAIGLASAEFAKSLTWKVIPFLQRL